MKKIILLIFAILLIITGLYFGRNLFQKSNVVDNEAIVIINSVTFSCAEDKKIQAIFFEDKVELTLSDKRNMLLNHAISASGARYANNDESFVFWNKGDTAFVVENNKTTFDDCIIVKEN